MFSFISLESPTQLAGRGRQKNIQLNIFLKVVISGYVYSLPPYGSVIIICYDAFIVILFKKYLNLLLFILFLYFIKSNGMVDDTRMSCIAL